MQFAAYVAPLIPRDRYMGFGVLSIPFYHPVRLIESMNLLDQLTKGKVLFGVGSGWQGTEPNGLGIDAGAHASGRLAEETLDIMERLWAFKYGDPELSFSVGNFSGRIKRRVTPAPYSKPYPTLIRVATREAGIVRAAQKGWPVFVGVLGADLGTQMQIYRRALDAAGHPQHVKDNCLRWCSYDWVGVTVADTDEEALAREKIARAETMAIRTDYIQRHGKMDGPVIKSTPGSIGYVELAFAIETSLPVTLVRNQAGTFVDPSLDSITAAASSFADKIPDDIKVLLVIHPRDISETTEYALDQFVRPVALFVYSSADAFAWMPAPTPTRYTGAIVRGEPATIAHSR
jgi:hypothetical protein